MLKIILVIVIIVFVVKKAKEYSNSGNYKNNQPKYEWIEATQEQGETTSKKGKNYINGYQTKWLLSYNEKAAYRTIKEVAEEKGYTVFTKVRLLDLVEPRDSNKKDQSYMWKIQAKHVDFVICDKNLVAKWIIELQDSSHKNGDRIERDNLVKAILTNCNYKILMTYSASKEEINTFLDGKPKTLGDEIKSSTASDGTADNS